MACVNNERIKEAREELDKIRSDEELMERIMLEEAYETDQRTAIANAIAEGEAIGEARGRSEGEEKTKRKNAKRMLELGLDIEIISKATELSIEEIEKLK